jgi:hypothetical protein
MHWSTPLKEISLAHKHRELATPISAMQTPLVALDAAILDLAAEALFKFVFSSCDRLDGKHDWNDCDENTRAGFRCEARAVIEAVWPILIWQKHALAPGLLDSESN